MWLMMAGASILLLLILAVLVLSTLALAKYIRRA